MATEQIWDINTAKLLNKTIQETQVKLLSLPFNQMSCAELLIFCWVNSTLIFPLVAVNSHKEKKRIVLFIVFTCLYLSNGFSLSNGETHISSLKKDWKAKLYTFTAMKFLWYDRNVLKF